MNIDVNGTVVEFPDNLDQNTLNSVVAKAASQIGSQPKQEPSWSGIGGRFINGAIDTAKGIYNLGTQSPSELHDTFTNPETNPAWQAIPHPGVNPQTGQMSLNPGGILTQAKNIVSHPMDTLKKDPFGTVMAVAPFLPPVVKSLGETSLFRGAANLGESALTKAGSYIGDIPEESVAYKMANPQAVKEALPIHELASTEVPRIAQKFDQTISGLHDAAKNTLSKSRYLGEGALTKDEVIGAVDSARTKLGGVYTAESEAADRTLDKVKGNLNKIRNTVSQNQVHDLIKDIDKEIPWEKVWKNPEDLTMTDHAMIDTRTKLDSLLKGKNGEYGKIMKPLSDQINSRNEFLKKFNVDKIKGVGYKPGDQTTSRLFGATNEDRLATQRTLADTKESLGEDLTPKVKASQVKADFQPETGRSFKNSEAGIRQTFGRPLVGKLIDKASEIKPISPLAESASKLAPALKHMKPKKIKQNGHTYILNEETGRYE